MSDRRKSFKQHVKAAKDWLGEAETSLDKENDLRGDLHLMLAQAELQRAQETKRLTARQRWIRRLVPVLCAVFIIGAVWQVFWMLYPKPMEAEPPVVLEKTAKTPIVREIPIEKPKQEENHEPAVHEAEVAVPVTESVVEEIPLSVEESTPKHETAGAVPSRDMQKLMNAAGQSLRAQ